MQKFKEYLQLALCASLFGHSPFILANETPPVSSSVQVATPVTPVDPIASAPSVPSLTSKVENTSAVPTPTPSMPAVENAQMPVVQPAQAPIAETQSIPVVVGNQVNINTANATEIQRVLLGIGAKKAEAIIQYREKNGAFTAIEQLLNVQGFGKATLEKNRERILL